MCQTYGWGKEVYNTFTFGIIVTVKEEMKTKKNYLLLKLRRIRKIIKALFLYVKYDIIGTKHEFILLDMKNK
jgi:hypothetical protein